MSLANDKVGHHVRLISGNSLVNAGIIRSGFENVISADTYAFIGSGNRSKRLEIVGEEAPSTNYDAVAQAGDEYLQLTYSSGVPATATKYMRTATGWSKALYGGDSVAAVVVSAAAELGRMWGSTTATSGIFRGLSVRTQFNTAGTASGDAGRFYNITNVSVSNLHGIHSTAQMGAEDAASVGTVTGQAAGVRATIGIGLTNTAPAGGTLAALRADSYFLSSAAGAQSSFIYLCDVGGSYGVDAIIRCGTIVDRSTNGSALKAYTYDVMTIAVNTPVVAFRVVTTDGTFYLMGWNDAGIAAT